MTQQRFQQQQRKRNGDKFQVGDRVREMNNYRNLKHVTGVVIKVTSAQATINPDNGGANFRKHKRNLKIIYNDG